MNGVTAAAAAGCEELQRHGCARNPDPGLEQGPTRSRNPGRRLVAAATASGRCRCPASCRWARIQIHTLFAIAVGHSSRILQQLCVVHRVRGRFTDFTQTEHHFTIRARVSLPARPSTATKKGKKEEEQGKQSSWLRKDSHVTGPCLGGHLSMCGCRLQPFQTVAAAVRCHGRERCRPRA